MRQRSDFGIDFKPIIKQTFGTQQALAGEMEIKCDPKFISKMLRSDPDSMLYLPYAMKAVIERGAFETTDEARAVVKKAYRAIEQRRDAEDLKAKLEAVIKGIDSRPKPVRKVEEPSSEVREQMQRIARISDEIAECVHEWRSKGWIPPE